ncbi:type 2 isopentenyl-diphosphate Delta-isomerase [uncultured Microbacterium sp.]|uniref:type 2 isopentenyl-diphosphate Delta-isomerase n=1 Tax=uncultured Microbacterium sp. TaxID=191216 RepID=UPI00261833BA|nr:type 2 isopentenyl-diphosphate Delta-isomerase [uncultured Microbacterium sp.]
MAAEDSRARAARKDDHLRLAPGSRPTGAHSEFDDLAFVHHALAGIDTAAIDLSTHVDGMRWSAPLYINGMTGGTTRTAAINRELAIAARETGIAMGTGSASIAVDDPSTSTGFRIVRDENPDGLVFANLGIGRGGDDVRRAVDLLEADALQIHINPVQEIAMPEGARDLSSWHASLEEMIAASPVPVIIKEVGFGLSRETLMRLRDLGVRIADVSGRGGTDFLRIENDRHADGGLSFLTGFGQSAPASLLDAPAGFPALLASGGVRNPFDVVKALALGARAVGVAGVFLDAAVEGGADALIVMIQRWLDQIRSIMALLGADSPAALVSTDLLVRGDLGEFCALRGIDAASFSTRSRATDSPD